MDRKEVLVENRLLKIEDNFITPSGRCCVVDIVVADAGAWHIKFRETCVIVNRRELILSNCVVADATLSFTSAEAFLELASLQASMEELQRRGVLRVQQRDTAFTTGLEKLFLTLTARNEGSLRTPKKKRPSTSSMNIDKKPLKAGWCFKKRDIIMGWRCRYFKVFQGQVEYFRDESDLIPRGVIPILGAEIKGPLKCTVNGAHECFSISIEPRHKDKVFKLASIKSGNDGMEDVLSWIGALVNAARPIEAVGVGDVFGGFSPEGDDASSLVPSDVGSPRLARNRSASTGSGAYNPPPLIPGSASSSRGSTRLRRSILGSVVAAVQRRGSATGAAGSMPSWVSSPAGGHPGGRSPLGTRAVSDDLSVDGDDGVSRSDTSSVASRERSQSASVPVEEKWPAFFRSGDKFLRAEIFVVCVAALIGGGLKGGLYGVIAVAFLCILAILIAFVPLAL